MRVSCSSVSHMGICCLCENIKALAFVPVVVMASLQSLSLSSGIRLHLMQAFLIRNSEFLFLVVTLDAALMHVIATNLNAFLSQV